MSAVNIAALVNLLGWTIGFALYAMLLVLAAKSLRSHIGGARHLAGGRRTMDFLPLATALLGLLWNAGALATQGLYELGFNAAPHLVTTLLSATSFAALGFLPAVVVHSALSDLVADAGGRRALLLVRISYTLSTLAAMMHFYQAFVAGEASSNTALQLLTFGFVLLMLGSTWLTHKETGSRRTVSAIALAVFAVSALHLSSSISHASHDRWYAELIGHHASLPLALAILYQDYRFAFADIFLKRALALLAFVALVTGAFLLYTVLSSPLTGGAAVAPNAEIYDARAISLLLAIWVGTGLLYPFLRALTNKFVEAVVLRRVDYGAWRAEATRAMQTHESVPPLLDDVCARLAPALTAAQVRWCETARTANDGAEELVTLTSRRIHDDVNLDLNTRSAPSASSRASVIVSIPTTEAPRYEILIGELAGGRRVLSDDIALLEATAIAIARRIDALRVTHERCEQVQREQEIAKLASEAQLRALRAQINPHFLFNALTTVGYLIQTSPSRAMETLLRLTDLLRRVLNASAEWTTLGDELKLVEAYLDIERARFEERLRVRVEVPTELHSLLVPSLIVQPLVENAIKHGIAPLRAGGEVQIAAHVAPAAAHAHNGRGREAGLDDSPMLVITVRDTGAGASDAQLSEGKRVGVGLANVEQRLRLCCDAGAELTIETESGAGATVRLSLPVRSGRGKRSALRADERYYVSPASGIVALNGDGSAPAIHTVVAVETKAE